MARKHLNIRAKWDLDGFRTSTQKLQKQMRKTGRSMQSMGRTMSYAFTAPFVGIGAVAIKSAADLESLKVQLKTAMDGSADAASAAFKVIEEFATRTPYSIEQVTGAFVKLKNMGLNPSMEALESYGNTASSMGKSLNQMIEAVADAAVGEFERLKEFGIKARSEGDRVSFTFKGITTTVGKNAAEIEEYLRGIGDTEFAGGIEAQSKTLNGVLSTLRDNFKMAAASFGELMLPALKKLSTGLKGFADNLRNLTPGAKKAIIVIGGLVAAIGPLLVGLAAVTSAVATLSAVSLPVVAVIVLVISAILQWAAAIIYIRKNIGAFEDFFYNAFVNIKNTAIDTVKSLLGIWKRLGKLAGIDLGLFDKLDSLKGTTRENTREFGSFKDALKETFMQVPTLKKAVDGLGSSVQNAGSKVTQFTEKQISDFKSKAQDFIQANEDIAESVRKNWRRVIPAEIKQGLGKLAEDLPQQIDFIKTNTIPKFEEMGIAMGQALTDALNGMLNNMAVMVGETLGNIMTGDFTPGDFGKAFLGIIGDFMGQFGAAMVSIGIAQLAIETAISSMNPALAIAGGIALIAAGKALSNISQNGLGGAGDSAGVSSNAGSYGGAAFGDNRYGMIQTQTVISGREMIITQQGEREFTRRRNRDTLFRK